MPNNILRVQMLGNFSISHAAASINSSNDRSKKLWLLVAYLICHRGACVPPDELIDLLWGGGSKDGNPANALKTMFHRARTLLNRLGENMGYDLLLRQEGGYAWNTEIPVEVDADKFIALCRSAAGMADEDARLACLLEALELYQGEFLEKLSSEVWVLPIASRYHHMYVMCAKEAVALLETQGRWKEMAELCRSALEREPCGEYFCQGLMTALIQVGDQRGAVEVYAEVRERLMGELGIPPSNEVRKLYQTALRAIAPQALSLSSLLAQLQEAPGDGALICDYDYFRSIYQAHARMSERNGDAAHLALVSVTDEDGGPPPRGLDRVMDHLQEILRLYLRRGDAAARCSISQFVVLLPQANYENSRMVCQRISKAFSRQYPHSSARVRTDIQPLAPSSERGEHTI